MSLPTHTISVIMPLFMMEHRLKKAFSSLYNQTMSDFQLIVVDDASPDASADVAKKLMERIPDATLIKNQSRLGLWATRRKGILAASGKYALFLDPREWLESDAMERLLAAIETFPADIVQMRRKKFVGRVAVKSSRPGNILCNQIISGQEYRTLARQIRINGEISPFCGDKLYRTDFLREATVHDFSANWGEVQIMNIHYLRIARSLVFIDYAGINVPWRDDFSNYKFSRLNDFKKLYSLKKILGQDPVMLKSELRMQLRYHIRQLLSELSWTREAILHFMQDELSDPIWNEVGEVFSISEIVDEEINKLKSPSIKNIASKIFE